MGAQRRRDEMESRFKFQHFIFGLLGGAWAGGTRAAVPAGRLMKRGWGVLCLAGPGTKPSPSMYPVLCAMRQPYQSTPLLNDEDVGSEAMAG